MPKSRHRYHMKDWKETTLAEGPGAAKLTRVEARFAYEGELSGETQVHYLMHYGPEGRGHYHGWERFKGQYRGRDAEGYFRHDGRFDAKGVDADVALVPESATGGLAGAALRFQVHFAGHGPYEIDVEGA